MPLTVLGLNHTTAPVAVREQLTFGPEIVSGALHNLCDLPEIQAAVIVSTCNRTEIYVNAAEQEGDQLLQSWASEFHGLALQDIGRYLYQYHEAKAIEHLLSVASGLDSLILGEPQILGQVKAAFQIARDAGHTDKLLQRLFQHAFSTAKQVRTQTAIGDNPVSVAFAAVRLAQQIFSDITQQTALLLGAGETIELAARHLHQQGIGQLIIANRSLANARKLAQTFAAEACSLVDLPTRLPEADIVVTATASPLPILGKGVVERALKQRRRQPIFMLDIAVPRNIEPEVAELSDVYLYTVDDLQAVIQENLRSRQEAARQAREMIRVQVDDFLGWLKSQSALDMIQHYRHQAEITRDEVLQKAQRQLANGKAPQEVLEFLANTLTNKLLHPPSSALRQAGQTGQDELLAAAKTLLHIKST